MNLKQIISKLASVAATPVMMPTPNEMQADKKCSGATGRIGNTVLQTPNLPNDKKGIEKAIKVYYGKLEIIVRQRCDGSANCGTKVSFENCFRMHHDEVVRDLISGLTIIDDTAMAAQDLRPGREPTVPNQNTPSQTGPTSTERRNCKLRRSRCLCQFYKAKALFEIRSAKEAEFFGLEVEKYSIPQTTPPQTPLQIERAKEKNRQKFQEECKKIKKESGYASDSPCSKDARDKFNYSDCREFCEKCTTGSPSPEGIEGIDFG